MIAVGRPSLEKTISDCLQGKKNDSDFSEMSRELLQTLYTELLGIDRAITLLEQRLEKIVAESDKCQRLLTIKGLGLISVSLLEVALGDAGQFKNGRQFSAWLGLVPSHVGTGGKNRILGISKRGDSSIRCLLVH